MTNRNTSPLTALLPAHWHEVPVEPLSKDPLRKGQCINYKGHSKKKIFFNPSVLEIIYIENL